MKRIRWALRKDLASAVLMWVFLPEYNFALTKFGTISGLLNTAGAVLCQMVESIIMGGSLMGFGLLLSEFVFDLNLVEVVFVIAC